MFLPCWPEINMEGTAFASENCAARWCVLALMIVTVLDFCPSLLCKCRHMWTQNKTHTHTHSCSSIILLKHLWFASHSLLQLRFWTSRDLGQITLAFCVSVSSFVRWGSEYLLTMFWQGLNVTINVRFLEECPVYNMHSVNAADYDDYCYQIKSSLTLAQRAQPRGLPISLGLVFYRSWLCFCISSAWNVYFLLLSFLSASNGLWWKDWNTLFL